MTKAIITIILMYTLSPTTNAHFTKKNKREDYLFAKELLNNSIEYFNPNNKTIHLESGYPHEGWNRELRLDSFTQLSAIGLWLEFTSSVAAGYCNPKFLDKKTALSYCETTINSLLNDQNDEALSCNGLLANFLQFDKLLRFS